MKKFRSTYLESISHVWIISTIRDVENGWLLICKAKTFICTYWVNKSRPHLPQITAGNERNNHSIWTSQLIIAAIVKVKQWIGHGWNISFRRCIILAHNEWFYDSVSQSFSELYYCISYPYQYWSYANFEVCCMWPMGRRPWVVNTIEWYLCLWRFWQWMCRLVATHGLWY